jgi:hypothetical protein
MSGNRWRVHGVLSVALILSLTPMQACGVAAPTDSALPASLEAPGQHDLSGVWTGTSITSCLPLRMSGPWRCGARADIRLTLNREDSASLTGIFVSERGPASDDYQETGRVVEVPVSGSTLWLRVMMRNDSSCLFSSDLLREEMGGSYICFRDGTSFERGHWAVRRNY